MYNMVFMTCKCFADNIIEGRYCFLFLEWKYDLCVNYATGFQPGKFIHSKDSQKFFKTLKSNGDDQKSVFHRAKICLFQSAENFSHWSNQ